MPAQEPVPGVARVVYSGNVGAAGTWANVHHVAQSDGGTGFAVDPWVESDIVLLAALMSAQWIAKQRTLINEACALLLTSVTDLTNSSGAVAVLASSSAGTRSLGTSMPGQVSCCVSWNENFHYRGGHLRTYLPPPGSADIQDSQRFTSTYVTLVGTTMGAWRAAVAANTSINASGLRLVGVHRFRDGAQLDTPIVKIINGESVDNRIDTMRRRLGPDV